MEYKILIHHEILFMEKMVNDLIQEGWLPLGGISNYDSAMVQAMTRNKI